MKIVKLVGIPSPEAFFGIAEGSDLSLFFDDARPDTKTPTTNTRMLRMRCSSFIVSGSGISLAGKVTEPPEYRENLALVDICWDLPHGYAGEAAISDTSQ